MRIKEYIRCCSDIELSEFLSSVYWSSITFDIVIKFFTIEEQTEAMLNLLQQEIPNLIPYAENKLIDTKTRKVLK